MGTAVADSNKTGRRRPERTGRGRRTVGRTRERRAAGPVRQVLGRGPREFRASQDIEQSVVRAIRQVSGSKRSPTSNGPGTGPIGTGVLPPPVLQTLKLRQSLTHGRVGVQNSTCSSNGSRGSGSGGIEDRSLPGFSFPRTGLDTGAKHQGSGPVRDIFHQVTYFTNPGESSPPLSLNRCRFRRISPGSSSLGPGLSSLNSAPLGGDNVPGSRVFPGGTSLPRPGNEIG